MDDEHTYVVAFFFTPFVACLDPIWLLAITIRRVVNNTAMSSTISIALSLECFSFFIVYHRRQILRVRLKGRRVTSFSPLVAYFFFKYSVDAKLTSVIKGLQLLTTLLSC
jgi:hypothetical protein